MRVHHFIFLLIILLLTRCKRDYLPPAISNPNNYLVVDGFINSGSDSTFIKLTKTRNLDDSMDYTHESGAHVMVYGSSGETYPLPEISAGIYAAENLNLNNNETFQLKIITSNGKIYLSDSVPVLQTPSIDSITWQQRQDGVHLFANTHDDTGNTKYYRWDYVETWEYHAAYFTPLIYSNGQVTDRTPDEYIYTCWRSQPSSTISLGTSSGLREPVISQADIHFIPDGDSRLKIGYSILVKQYAITRDAFTFWQTLLKNTENRGSLFDPQPSQTVGNIHCISNPEEPVIGYVGAGTMEKQRLFISSAEIPNWADSSLTCQSLFVKLDPDLMDLYFSNGIYLPVEKVYDFSVLIGYNAYHKDCVDCRVNGGSTTKPLFWP